MSHACWGQHEAGYMSWCAYFRNEVGLKNETNKIQGLLEISQSAGWFWPHENICWITERPSLLKRDERGRLHCEDGPALQYPDGWSIYRFHGVSIPEWVINNPEKINSRSIEEEKNAEVRRVMVERYPGGLEKYLTDSGAEEIARDDFGILYRKQEKDDEPIWAVKVCCPTTQRDYFLGVDPNAYGGLKTARAAVASTWRNVDGSMVFASPEEYAPLMES